jgi:hypothetical protein
MICSTVVEVVDRVDGSQSFVSEGVLVSLPGDVVPDGGYQVGGDVHGVALVVLDPEDGVGRTVGEVMCQPREVELKEPVGGPG